MITKVNNTVLDLENPTVDGLDMGGNVISNHGSPTFSGDVANKLYVDTIAGAGPSGFLPLSGGTMDLGANIGMNTGRIIGLSTPVSGGDAANKGYVDTEIVLAIALATYGGPTFITPVVVVSTSAAVPGFTLFDVSGSVPVGTTTVILDYSGAHGPATPSGSVVSVRETGTADVYRLTSKGSGNAGSDHVSGQGMCPINGSRQFDYQITTGWSGTMTIRVIGYF